MKKVISHDLGQDKAKKVINRAAQEYSDKYPEYQPTFMWKSDSQAVLSLTVMRKSISATITLHPTNVEVELEVPPAFKMFEGKAMSAIDGEVQKWLKKAKSGKI